MILNKLRLEFPRKDPPLRIPKQFSKKNELLKAQNLENSFKVQYSKLAGFLKDLSETLPGIERLDLAEGPFFFPCLSFCHEAAKHLSCKICILPYKSSSN